MIIALNTKYDATEQAARLERVYSLLIKLQEDKQTVSPECLGREPVETVEEVPADGASISQPF